jgi:two-component system, cell cycle sensor histidine kinase and response regulator CckA
VKKASIMVVEDEGIVGLQIKKSLESHGYSVPVVALSGEDALRRIAQTEIDLIVLDIRLKGKLTGIEVARRVRATLKIPVIYLTAHSDEETLRQARETDPCGYLVKPFDERALDAIVQIGLYNSERARRDRERDRWKAAILDSMSDAILLCDDKGLLAFVNAAGEKLLRSSLSDLLGRRPGDVVKLVDAATGEPVPFPVTAPLAEGRASGPLGCIVTVPGGAAKRVELNASPLLSAEGTVFGILYVLR